MFGRATWMDCTVYQWNMEGCTLLWIGFTAVHLLVESFGFVDHVIGHGRRFSVPNECVRKDGDTSIVALITQS